jgi:hypothetical protein
MNFLKRRGNEKEAVAPAPPVETVNRTPTIQAVSDIDFCTVGSHSKAELGQIFSEGRIDRGKLIKGHRAFPTPPENEIQTNTETNVKRTWSEYNDGFDDYSRKQQNPY